MEFGLIGEKLSHSYSPQIHAHFAPYRYELRELSPQALPGFLAARGFRGLNVTIPYKKAVMPFCGELSDAARETGSVNTLLVRPDGSLFGHNTDVSGFIYMLREAGIGVSGRKAAVLGSGGASLAVQTALRRLGAREIVVVSRSGPVDHEAFYRLHGDTELLVNATPVGMYPETGVSPADLSRLPHLRGVADLIYNPEVTALVADARLRGLPAVSGLSMLVRQAHEAAELFCGHALPEEKCADVCTAIRRQRLNLVFTGMPGCGKTTVGRLCAELLGRPFVDCDSEIVRCAGMSIPEIFAQHGEAGFRTLEAAVIADVCRRSGLVIATGGGAVLRAENVRAMQQNGRVCFLRRGLDALAREGRPLSTGPDRLRLMWSQRRALYEAAADLTIDNSAAPETAAGAAKEAFYEAARH